MEERLITPLNKLEASLNSLIHALTVTNTFSGGPKAAEELVSADNDLDSALISLKAHQDNYATILQLRAEKDALQHRLKDTLFEAWRLRTELGNIHPSILEDTDEEEDAEQKYNPVDYKTLLAFASRIGKHNAIAAQEAEKESERQFVEARRKREEERSKHQPVMNGSHAEDTAPELDTTRPTTSQSMQTPEIANNMQDMRNTVMYQRALKTAPFPNAEDLRKGALGRLQLIKEQHGEDAMDAEVEKMVRETEMKQVTSERQASEAEAEVEPEVGPVRRESVIQPRTSQQLHAGHQSRPRKKIDLDFPGDDDEEDE